MIIFTTQSCNFERGSDHNDDFFSHIPEDSLREYQKYANKALLEHEERVINQFLRRYGWDMTKTKSGLRYVIYHEGDGRLALPGDIVKMKCNVKLINGIEVFSAEKDGVQDLMIEKSDFVSGLHELLQYMNEGAKAKAIIPSFLAYGFTGDQEQIPKGATLVYDIELLEIASYK